MGNAKALDGYFLRSVSMFPQPPQFNNTIKNFTYILSIFIDKTYYLIRGKVFRNGATQGYGKIWMITIFAGTIKISVSLMSTLYTNIVLMPMNIYKL